MLIFRVDVIAHRADERWLSALEVRRRFPVPTSRANSKNSLSANTLYCKVIATSKHRVSKSVVS